MSLNSTRYHTILASFFSAQPLFFNSEQQKKPHIRKCIEQPWQQTKAQLWDEITETLCNLYFIQTKCAAGMTYELVRDFIAALKVLPDTMEEVIKEDDQQIRTQKFIRDLVAYNKGKINSVDVMGSVVPWHNDKIEADNARILHSPERADTINTFAQFVNSESHVLFKYGQQSGFNVIQHALNYSGSGPLAEAADKMAGFEFKNSRNAPLLRVRSKYNPHRAQIRTLEDHKYPIRALALSYDGNIAVSGGGYFESDNHLRVWDVKSGLFLFALYGHEQPIKAITITPDGKIAASAGEDKTIRIWDLEKRSCSRIMTGHQEEINALALSPDGSIIVSGGNDTKIKIWNCNTGRSLLTIDGKTDRINSVVLTSDLRYVITAGGCPKSYYAVLPRNSDYSIRIWNIKTGKCIKTLIGHNNSIEVIISTNGNRKLISGDCEGNIRTWDLETGLCKSIINTGARGLTAIAVTSDGKYAILSHAGSGIIHLWDIEAQLLLRSFHGHLDPVWAVALTPEGQLAISAGGAESSFFGKNDFSIRIWNITKGITEEVTNIHKDGVHSVAVTHDSKYVISGGGDPDETKREMVGTPNLWVWDLAINERIKTLRLSYASKVLPVFESSNIIAAAERSLFIYDVLSGKELRSVLAQQEGIWTAAITPDGQRAVFGCGGAVQVWDMVSDKCQLTLLDKPPYGSGGVHALALTPDGSHIVSSSDGNLFIWNIDDGRCLHACEGKDIVSAIAFTPDGRLFVSAIKGTYDNRPDSFLRVWDINGCNCIQTLEGHLDGVNALAITPDGRYAVSGGGGRNNDYLIRIWEIKTGKCIRALEGHTDQITSLAISSDGMRLFSISKDRTSRIWETKSGICLNITAHFSDITAFSLKNNILAMGYRSGNVRLFDCFDNILPLITPVHLYHSGSKSWDESPTSCCDFCGQRFTLPDSVYKTILRIHSDQDITHDVSPCQSLPHEVWNDPGLISECPNCGEKLKFNPFIVNNSERQDLKNSFNGIGSWEEDTTKDGKDKGEKKELSGNKSLDGLMKSINENLLYLQQVNKSKLATEKEIREKVIKGKLQEEVRNRIENIDLEFNSIYEEAEKAFAEENWEKAKALYLKLVQQGKFNAEQLRYNIAICYLNQLVDTNPEIINHIRNLIDLLGKSNAGEKAQMISDKLEERLKTIRLKDASTIKNEKPWWKEIF